MIEGVSYIKCYSLACSHQRDASVSWHDEDSGHCITVWRRTFYCQASQTLQCFSGVFTVSFSGNELTHKLRQGSLKRLNESCQRFMPLAKTWLDDEGMVDAIILRMFIGHNGTLIRHYSARYRIQMPLASAPSERVLMLLSALPQSGDWR